ncbi:MAG: hypothetical protein CME65_10310 [Halobacteriovoraceae bacterium]|nr:hypothetical protein [Halobacteriovoraceae bacterium]|tara:strand:- start:4517 stop:5275 length:759 start_codon:yes stop_codon:yes gene_type:complete
MKNLTILLIVLGICNLCSDVFAQEARISRLKTKKKKTKVVYKRRKRDDSLSKLIENNKKLNALLNAKTSLPVIWEGEKQVLTGKTYRGTLLNTIVSTNQATPVLVRAHLNQGLPYNSKFSCQAMTQNKRVFCLCNKLITTKKEIPIQAQLLNVDGSSGLEGIYEDGKEELIAGAVLSDFSQGMLSAAQNRIATPFGAIQDTTLKNQLLQGVINSANTTSEVLLDEMKQTVPVITIEAGTEVLIYFMEAINEN